MPLQKQIPPNCVTDIRRGKFSPRRFFYKSLFPLIREGIRRAKDRVSSADIVVLLIDATQVYHNNNNNNDNDALRHWNLDNHLRELGIDHFLKHPSLTNAAVHSPSSTSPSSSSLSINTNNTTSPSHKKLLVVFNKFDLVNSDALSRIPSDQLHPTFLGSSSFSRISCASSSGVDTFVAALKDEVVALCNEDFPDKNGGEKNGASVFIGQRRALITRARHKEHVTHCLTAISRCLKRIDKSSVNEVDDDGDDDCHSLRYDTGVIAEDLRLAIRHLGLITGKVRTDDILDIIFKEFCIGK